MIKLLYFFIGLCTVGCIHASPKLADSYPDIWWKPVAESELKGWEIPPQTARREKGEVILSKRNELGQFSNLAPLGFVLDGIKYGSVEGLWQGMKYPENSKDARLADPSVVWPFTREQVYAMSGFDSKAAGDLANANMKKLGINWITYQGQKIEYKSLGIERHYQIILEASRAKIVQNDDLKKLLISTGNLKLLPDHQQQVNPPPAYLYHEIYMKIRSDIK